MTWVQVWFLSSFSSLQSSSVSGFSWSCSAPDSRQIQEELAKIALELQTRNDSLVND